MFCGEEERVPDSVSGATDGESQDDFDLMESDCDEDYSELSAFCMWYIYHTIRTWYVAYHMYIDSRNR